MNTKNNIKYYKFTAPANKTYIFSATAPSSSQALTVKLCDNNGVKKGIETTFSNGASAKVKLIQNEVIYFGISSLSPINNVSLQVQSEENTYYWFYGENENEQNNILYNDVLSIPRGKTYYIYLKQKTNYGFFEGDYVYENYVNSSVGTYTNKRIEIKSNSVLNSDSFIKAKDEYGELANLYFNVRYENNITFDLVNNKSITLNWDKNKCPDIKEVECAIIMPGKADYIFTITNAKFQTNSWIFMTESGNPDANAILYNSYFDSLAFPYNVTFKVNKIVLNNNSEVSNTEYTLSSKNFNVSFDSGEGTASNPFVVRTIRHFNNITRALNRYYIQAEMINFNYATPATTGYYFSGNYNGNNYFIHSPSVNIAVSSTFKEVGCLFAGNSGTLRNIKLGTPRITSASDTTGVYNVGGFVGFNNGTVDNCSITLSNFTVNKLHGYTGGIVGYNNGTIISTRMYGTVLANNNVGGVAGVNHGTIASCNSETNVNLYQIGANNRAAGGVAGVNFGTIRNCIITLSVSYVSPRDTNKDIAPCLGLIAGQQASNNQGQVYSNTVQNTINTGELIKYGGIFGIGAYDQKKYVGGNFGRLI